MSEFNHILHWGYLAVFPESNIFWSDSASCLYAGRFDTCQTWATLDDTADVRLVPLRKVLISCFSGTSVGTLTIV